MCLVSVLLGLMLVIGIIISINILAVKQINKVFLKVLIILTPVILVVAGSFGAWFYSVHQFKNAFNDDKVVASDVWIVENSTLQDYDIVDVYYSEEKDEYYYLAKHIFKFWDIYEKKYLEEDFVNLKIKEQEYYTKMFN